MTDATTFDRNRHGLRATRKFIRSGVVGREGEGDVPNLTEAEVARLSDDDIATLKEMGLVEFIHKESGRAAPKVQAPTEGEG